MITRREMLRTAVGGAAALSLPGLTLAAQPAGKGFTLPKLPYAYDALEPSIDAETMMIHHDKHHQGYVNNLNKAMEGAGDWAGKPLEEILANIKKLPEGIQTAVRNNGGGHLNHSWFWLMMAKAGTGGAPSPELAKAIETSFTNIEGFKKEFSDAAGKRFGSGWVWLVVGAEKPLAVVSTANQDNPIMDGGKPILGLDVWEHAYYLKYRNVRGQYVDNWYNVVNWNTANDMYAAATKK